MELNASYTEEFILFLQQWPNHLAYISFAGVVWALIVIHLFASGHATLGTNGDSDDIGCGDIRVHRLMVIFGGPAGLSFGLPYYLFMRTIGLTGLVEDYWSGFVYLQFVTSLLQTGTLLLYALFGPRGKKWWKFFKSHLKGCGWVSGLSPLGWILYLLQQLTPNNTIKALFWILRDVETSLVFVFNVLFGYIVAICGLASVLHLRLIVPFIWWIDEDHAKDEDSSPGGFGWSREVK